MTWAKMSIILADVLNYRLVEDVNVLRLEQICEKSVGRVEGTVNVVTYCKWDVVLREASPSDIACMVCYISLQGGSNPPLLKPCSPIKEESPTKNHRHVKDDEVLEAFTTFGQNAESKPKEWRLASPELKGEIKWVSEEDVRSHL
jgi:hypothetical protein